MIRSLTLFIALTLLSVNSIACLCDWHGLSLKDLDTRSYKSTPVIILAWVEPMDPGNDEFFRIRINEIFKGDLEPLDTRGTKLSYKGEKGTAFSSCDIFFPHTSGDALLYLEWVEINGRRALKPTGCGPSRFLDFHDSDNIKPFIPNKKKKLNEAKEWTAEWIETMRKMEK